MRRAEENGRFICFWPRRKPPAHLFLLVVQIYDEHGGSQTQLGLVRWRRRWVSPKDDMFGVGDFVDGQSELGTNCRLTCTYIPLIFLLRSGTTDCLPNHVVGGQWPYLEGNSPTLVHGVFGGVFFCI